MGSSNKFDMKQLLSILSKVNKKDLQNSIQKANEIMQSNNKDEIINELKKNMDNNE